MALRGGTYKREGGTYGKCPHSIGQSPIGAAAQKWAWMRCKALRLVSPQQNKAVCTKESVACWQNRPLNAMAVKGLNNGQN